MNLVEDRDLALRLMRDDEADYAVMARWLTDPQVLEYYEGRDNPFPVERVRREFSPGVLAREHVTPCLFLLNSEPIGFAQYYPIDEQGRLAYELDADDLTAMYGIDQFIGVPKLWNTGTGTRSVSLLLRYLFEQLRARQVILDPHVENPRAIRCYEKCGFRKVKLLRAHEVHEGDVGDCWLMSVTLPEWIARSSGYPA
jgi:aminoglycoside 6'-N-acetyltransferase